MNKLIEAAIKRTVLILTSIAIIMAWGGLSAYRMQRDYLPPIQNPTLMVSLHAPNLQAEQIKAAFTEPIARTVRKVDGLQTLETNSFDGGLLLSL